MIRPVKQVKALRATTQRGVFTRLRSPLEGNVCAWQFADENRVILCAYRLLNRPNTAPERIRLREVPEGLYRGPDGFAVRGTDLERAGVEIPFPKEDFASCVMLFERIPEKG